MLLFAVAIVFVGLGWHSAATSGNSAQDQLQAAESSAPATSAAPTPSTSSTVAQGDTKICVINAGTTSGLATEVDQQVTAKGFTTIGINSASNYSRGGFNENSILYSTQSQKELADKIDQALGGNYSVESRSALASGFTPCQGGIAVVVVTR